jgi:hypothetical protein
MRPLRPAVIAVLACLVAAAPASAIEDQMLGTANFTHVANLQYEQRYDSGGNHGSDIEFGELTVSAPAAQTPPSVPPAAKPGTRTRSSASKRHRACVKKAKRKKGPARKRAMRKCKKVRAKRSSLDANPSVPGVQHTFAFAGTYYNGLQIIDVNDPEHPVIVNSYDCGIAQGDVQVFHRPDYPGRTFVAYAADDAYSFQVDAKCATEAAERGFDIETSGGSGTFIIDVTDPLKAHTVSFVGFEKGSHNQTVHPSGMYLYNSNSDLATDTSPGIEIADIHDLAHPKQIAVVPIPIMPGLGSDSHDISFSPDGTRAYSAAVSQGVILDTTDPANPKRISSIFDPAVNVWHQAETVEADVPGLGTRTLLIGSDEFAGATPTGQCPNGGLHIYDVTGQLEAAPVKLGYWNFDEVRATEDGGNCTAHVFQLFRDQNIMVIANYNGGVHVLDISGLAGLGAGATSTGIKELGRARFTDAETWAAKSPRFDRKGVSYIFGNDEVRGLDVYRFDATK